MLLAKHKWFTITTCEYLHRNYPFRPQHGKQASCTAHWYQVNSSGWPAPFSTGDSRECYGCAYDKKHRNCVNGKKFKW